jgi:hypothetical protein
MRAATWKVGDAAATLLGEDINEAEQSRTSFVYGVNRSGEAIGWEERSNYGTSSEVIGGAAWQLGVHRWLGAPAAFIATPDSPRYVHEPAGINNTGIIAYNNPKFRS